MPKSKEINELFESDTLSNQKDKNIKSNRNKLIDLFDSTEDKQSNYFAPTTKSKEPGLFDNSGQKKTVLFLKLKKKK